jgi:hypothetical protein
MFPLLLACHRAKVPGLLYNVIAYRLDVDNECTTVLTKLFLVVCIRLLPNCLQVVSYRSHISLQSLADPINDHTLSSASSILSYSLIGSIFTGFAEALW